MSYPDEIPLVPADHEHDELVTAGIHHALASHLRAEHGYEGSAPRDPDGWGHGTGRLFREHERIHDAKDPR